MTEVYVSPQHVASDFIGASVEKKLEVFEAQLKGWLLDHADALASPSYPTGQHAGISILTLCLVYVETIACFIKGQSSDGKSGPFFKAGLLAIFPELQTSTEKFFSDFYREVRCGLIHQGMTRAKIGIFRGAQQPIQSELDSIGALKFALVDPWLFLARAKQHFDQYLADARNPANGPLRSNFELWFEQRPA